MQQIICFKSQPSLVNVMALYDEESLGYMDEYPMKLLCHSYTDRATLPCTSLALSLVAETTLYVYHMRLIYGSLNYFMSIAAIYKSNLSCLK